MRRHLLANETAHEKENRNVLQTTYWGKVKCCFLSCSISLCYVEAVYQPSHYTNRRRGKFFLIRFILKGLAPNEGIILLGFSGLCVTKFGLVSKACDVLKKQLKIKSK